MHKRQTAALWTSSAICGGLLFSAGRPGGLITEIIWKARPAKAWVGERQMAAASNAYEANVMMETAAGGDSLLG